MSPFEIIFLIAHILYLKHYLGFWRDPTSGVAVERMIQDESMASVFWESYSMMEESDKCTHQLRVIKIEDHRVWIENREKLVFMLTFWMHSYGTGNSPIP